MRMINWKRTELKPRKSVIKYGVAQSRDVKGYEIIEGSEL